MHLPYGKYKNARNAAWQCLIDNSVSALPVSVSRISRSSGIRLGTYSKNSVLIERLGLGELMENDGFSTHTSLGFIVLYRDDFTPGRVRFTVAHELGHIFLGHLFSSANGVPCTVFNRGPAPSDDPFEYGANVFASRLLAPACVLWGVGARTAGQIASLCDISMEASSIRAERMAILRDREARLLADRHPSCFLLSPMERQVYLNFYDYIKNNPLE